MNQLAATKTVLVVCTYPLDTAPSQRFRFEQYIQLLSERGIELTIRPFWSSRAYTGLYERRHQLRKFLGVLAGFFRRVLLVPEALRADYVFIFREATPIGPPWFEWLLFKAKRHVIYDFDDAIFVSFESVTGSRLVQLVKWTSKVAWITRRSSQVTVCNQFLKDWALRLNPNVVLLPTTVDSQYFESSRAHSADRLPVIGWSGSYSTAKYLELVRSVLVRLQQEYDFEFIVICNYDPGFAELKRYRFIKWQSATEVEGLSTLDIGLMPVSEGTWEKGKVGLKAIQYSALGVVPVVSKTGSGPEVVQDGKTGLVVDNTEDAWYAALAQLLENRSSWQTMGRCAKEYVFPLYSVASQAPVYISLFQ